jgi:hypothetical protein
MPEADELQRVARQWIQKAENDLKTLHTPYRWEKIALQTPYASMPSSVSRSM